MGFGIKEKSFYLNWLEIGVAVEEFAQFSWYG